MLATTLHGPSLFAARAHDLLAEASLPLHVYLDDPATTDILVNADNRVWIEDATGMHPTDTTLAPGVVEHFLRLVAASMELEIHAANPTLSAVLPGSGYRVQGLVPPLVAQPILAIRKPATTRYQLSDYVACGMMSATQAQVLRTAVRERKNIVVLGGAGSGKTTLVNALLAEVAQTTERVVLLEEGVPELQCATPNCVALTTREGLRSLRDLVKDTLRLRPDRIIVGEVRGGEALDMLKAWGTGHPGGISTLHADNAEDALLRLELLAQEATPVVPQQLIARSVHLLVTVRRTTTGARRAVQSIEEVLGLVQGAYHLRTVA